jgi:hypothetical protein
VYRLQLCVNYLVSVTYRVLKPLLAIRHEPGVAAVLLTLSPGSLFTLKGEVEETGFVDVLYAGQVVKVYMRDIEESAERVEGTAS